MFSHPRPSGTILTAPTLRAAVILTLRAAIVPHPSDTLLTAALTQLGLKDSALRAAVTIFHLLHDFRQRQPLQFAVLPTDDERRVPLQQALTEGFDLVGKYAEVRGGGSLCGVGSHCRLRCGV